MKSGAVTEGPGMTSAGDESTTRPTPGFRELLGLVRTRPGTIAAACSTSSLSALLGLVPALLVFAMAREVLSEAPDASRVTMYAGLAVIAALAKHALFGLSTALAHGAAFGILYDLRIRLARKMASVPLGFFSRRKTGSLHKAMSEDVGGLEAFLAHMLPDAAAAFTIPVAAVIVMVVVDWRMALAALAAVPVAVGVQFAMLTGEARESYARYHEVTDATKRAVHGYLRGIHVVKAFGLGKRSFGELERAVRRMTDYVEEYARRSAPPFIVAIKLLSGGTNALFIVPVGVWLYSRGTLELPVLVFFLVVAPQVLSPFLRIATALGQLQILLRGAGNILDVLDEPTLPSGSGSPLPPSRTLRFEHVGFGYRDDEPVLHDIDFEARENSVTALVGGSGAGKTTIARLVPRFWDVSKGRVTVGGVDVRELDLDRWLDELSLVFQDVFLFSGSVAENLRLAAPQATREQLEAACRAARIHDTIEALPEGYDTPVGDRGARLSGGERQRLSIARAFLKDAAVVVLDEATAFADAHSEAEIHTALQALARGKTVVVIAHKLSTIRNADHIVVLEEGRVVGQGSHDALRGRCAEYDRLWDAYSGSLGWSLGVAQGGPS